MDADSRVALERIGGDIRLIRQSQEQSERNLERFERNNADFQRTTNERFQSHSSRLGVLEAANSVAAGVKQGTERTLRMAHVIWASATSAGVVGAVAFVLRSMHV